MTNELAKKETGELTAAREKLYLRPYYEVEAADDNYTVRVFMPGVALKSVAVTNENDSLKITGTHNWQTPEKWRALHREIRGEDYGLLLRLGREINPEKIAAKMADGVLELTLPKKESIKPRTIAVQ
jgi:HSP20 family protein